MRYVMANRQLKGRTAQAASPTVMADNDYEIPNHAKQLIATTGVKFQSTPDMQRGEDCDENRQMLSGELRWMSWEYP